MKSIILAAVCGCSLIANCYEIVLPANPAPHEQRAAAELNHYIPKVAQVLTLDGTEPEIHVGPTDAAKATGLDKLASEEWVIRSDGNKLYLTGGGTRGTLYAVYHFLEDQLGIHWFTVDEEYIPAPGKINLTALDRKGKPFFAHRSIARCFRGTLPFDKGLFAARNRMNFDANSSIAAEYGGGDSFGQPSFVHTFGRYFSKEQYSQYYTLLGGKRGTVPHICMSHPDLPEMFYNKLLEYIAKSEEQAVKQGLEVPHYYDISLDDGSYRCDCAPCAAAMKQPGGGVRLLLGLLNPIAEKLATARPDLTLTTLAYLNVLEPPAAAKIAPNLLVRLCDTKSNQAAPITTPGNRLWADIVKKWGKLSSNLGIWDYGITYAFTGFPYPGERVMPQDLRFYADNGIKFMFWELEVPELADMYELKIWMTMKLMEDPYQDATKLYDTFMDKYYGPAAPALKKFRDLVAENADRKKVFIDWYAKTTAFKHLNASTLPEMQSCFDEAEQAAAADPLYLNRVKRARIGTDRACYIMFPMLLAEYEKSGSKRENYPLNRAEILKRAEANRLAAVEKLNPRWGTTKEKMREAVTAEIKRYGNIPLTLRAPAKFANVPFFDFPASEAYNHKNTAKLIDDPESETGQVLYLLTGDTVPSEYNIPMAYGAYEPATATASNQNRIRQIPGRGYQWYKLMTLKPQDSTYIYLTGKWYIQFHTGNPTPGLDENYDVWIRLKFAGPAYFPGDKQPNAIYFERLIMTPAK